MTLSDARLYPGDILPETILPGVGGQRVDLRGQAVAGRTLLLWLHAEVPDAETLTRFTHVQRQAGEVETVALGRLMGLIDAGDLVDGKSMLAVLMAERRGKFVAT